jgi:hypothetical protein
VARVIVLGFDGLDPSMADEMPTLSRMRLLRLDSIVPVTYSSWPTIMSGVGPGKHSLYGFHKIYRDSDGRWRWRLHTAHDLDYPRIHEALALTPQGRRIRFFLANPLPPEPTIPAPQGSFIANVDFFGAPWSTDPGLFERLYGSLDASTQPTSLEEEIERLRVHRDALEEAAGRGYDLVWYNIHVPDRVLHRDPGLLEKPSRLRRLLAELDEIARRARSLADNLVVVSDHGFGLFRTRLWLNNLLLEKGYAVKTYNPDRLLVIGVAENRVAITGRKAEIAARIARGPLRRIARAIIRRLRVEYELRYGVDAYASKAFAPQISSRTGPVNTVLFNDLAVRPEVRRLLEQAGVDALLPEEATPGPHARKDMLIVAQREHMVLPGPVPGPAIEERPIANHRRYGVLAYRLEDDLLEPPGDTVPGHAVAPMVLALLGAPLDPYMDGARYIPEEHWPGRTSYRARWRIAARTRRAAAKIRAARGA